MYWKNSDRYVFLYLSYHAIGAVDIEDNHHPQTSALANVMRRSDFASGNRDPIIYIILYEGMKLGWLVYVCTWHLHPSYRYVVPIINNPAGRSDNPVSCVVSCLIRWKWREVIFYINRIWVIIEPPRQRSFQDSWQKDQGESRILGS